MPLQEFEHHKYAVGDLVYKARGYKFPGIIVSCFHNTKYEARYVVECTASGVEGCLHIYSTHDLILRV